MILLLFAAKMAAQEQAIYTQYNIYPILVNPGYTGFENKHQFLFNSRQSFAGFPGAPKTYTLMYNGPIGDKLALGGGLFSDKIGSESLMRIQINYAFRFQIKDLKMGLGLSTEFLNRTLDQGLLDHNLVQTGDPDLEEAVSGQKIFDASIGFHGLYSERFFFGMALPNTVRARLDEVPVEEQSNSSSLFKYTVFQLGYIFDIKEQNFKVIPSINFRKVRNVPFQVDMNVRGLFLDERLIAGLTFRPSTEGALAFQIGTKQKSLQFYYSYDVSFQRSQKYHGGSHELSVSFELDKKQAKMDPNQRN